MRATFIVSVAFERLGQQASVVRSELEYVHDAEGGIRALDAGLDQLETLGVAEPELVEALGLGPADIARSGPAGRIGILVMPDQGLPVFVSCPLHGGSDLRPGEGHLRLGGYAPEAMEPTRRHRVADVQASAPAIPVSLSRVGVTNVEKVARIGPRGADQLYYVKLDCFVALGREQKGAHMSRFEEVVNDVIGEVMLGDGGFKAEQLAQKIAVGVRERQGAARAEVTIAARYPEYKPAPVSGIATQEIYTLLGSAVATERGTRRLVGVAAQGMTASPRAQQLAAARSRALLAADGFTTDQIAGIFEAVPVATHNQRGLGTLHLGLPEDCDTDVDAAELLAIVEGSRSSEIYELMKRSDEGAVVETAHGRPRFVEDCVREALRGAIERFGGLHDDAFVSARQENLETIREHNLVAERCGLIRELRRERDTGVHAGHHTTMREWLEAAG